MAIHTKDINVLTLEEKYLLLDMYNLMSLEFSFSELFSPNKSDPRHH